MYLDYAARAPVREEVLSLVSELLSMSANPSSIHSEGVTVRARIESARGRTARVLGSSSEEIFFTSGATEALNLAIMGVVRAARKEENPRPHVITSAIEHPAILETLRALAREGVEVTELIPDARGVISASELRASLKKETVLLAFSLVNAEMGVIFPVKDCAKEIRLFRKKHESTSAYPYLLLDATQAPLYFPLDVRKLHADLLVLDGGKIGGLTGSGLLYLRRGAEILPIMFGGGQERGIRPGTENLLAIETLATALELAQNESNALSKTVGNLSELFVQNVLENIPGSKCNGFEAERAPHIVSICFPGIDAEWLVIQLDAHGISASRGSACKSRKGEALETLRALDPECARYSVRFSFGRETTFEEIETTVQALKKCADRCSF